jgi:hypothetical protein
MSCLACIAREKTWRGDDPKCAFTEGVFTRENYRCATADLIRDITEIEDNPNIHRVFCESEERYATINVDDIDALGEEGHPLALWVQWYKNRGGTQGMLLMFENAPPRPPTEAECVAIIEYYKKK